MKASFVIIDVISFASTLGQFSGDSINLIISGKWKLTYRADTVYNTINLKHVSPVKIIDFQKCDDSTEIATFPEEVRNARKGNIFRNIRMIEFDTLDQIIDTSYHVGSLYDAVTINSGSTLQMYFQKSIDGKPGFHVYYLSISSSFHTLLLVIDSRIPGNEIYSIYDQHGKTSSYGALTDIEEGFARQTSWTYLNFYVNKGYNPNVRSGVTTKIWKIRRT